MASEDENKLKLLRSKQETLFRRAQMAFDLIPNLDKDPKVLQNFLIRARTIDDNRAEFAQVVEKVNNLAIVVEPTATHNYEVLGAFDDMYGAITIAREKYEPHVLGNKLETLTKEASSLVSHLPRIPLKHFSGELTDWFTFHSLFTSLVDNNKGLSQIQKFQYLQSCLSGDAASLIKHLPLLEKNYDVALSILRDRFHSVRHLASIHVEKILNLKPRSSDSYLSLRSLYEVLNENNSALEALSIPNMSDFLLFHLAFRNLHSNTRQLFEAQHRQKQAALQAANLSPVSEEGAIAIPTFKELMSFLSGHCKVLESSNLVSAKLVSPSTSSATSRRQPQKETQFSRNVKGYTATSQPSRHYNHSKTSPQSNFTKNKLPCPVCKGLHSIYTCSEFLAHSPSQRLQLVRSLGRCEHCLGFHRTSDCRSRFACVRCNSTLHHTALHVEDSQPEPVSSASHDSTGAVQINNASLHSDYSTVSVILGTAVVHIQDSTGGYMEARMLLDSGAQSTFLTRSFFSRLGLSYRKTDVTVTGLGQTSVTHARGTTSIVLKPRFSIEPCLHTEAIIMDQLTGQLPAHPLQESVRQQFSHLKLADPNFSRPSPIDGIIGAELIPYIYNGASKLNSPGEPCAMSSIFGWIITGPVSQNNSISAFTAEVTLDSTLRKFWEVEELPLSPVSNPEDNLCESIFLSRFKRQPDGRYVVPLMLRDNYSQLGGSYGYALRCFTNLERRLDKNAELKTEYHKFMNEYESLGHMRALTKPCSLPTYIIPHHPVFNPSSTSTKLRVVFNGSAKTTSSLSLNDVLYAGPKLQTDITAIIGKFRLHVIAFTADVERMFRQFNILPDETRFQHILWRYSQDQPIIEYELLTNTYGLRSAPYLAGRSLHQIAIDEGSSYPRARQIIMEETYVDNIISGARSVEEALELQKQVINILARGGLKLRKWSSNHPSLLTGIPDEDCEEPLVFDSDETITIKILGLQWSPKSDYFMYKISKLEPQCTKRGLLSDISRLYDPMGWLSPIVFLAKQLIQRLWVLGLSWDEIIPTECQDVWNKIVLELPSLSQVRIPRHVVVSTGATYKLVGFSDASERGYGAVVYLHVTTSVRCYSYILYAKSRVAPLRTVSIPRLELLGAWLLSKLIKQTQSVYCTLPLDEAIVFTDSTTVLTWLKTPPFQLKTFVANRVVDITNFIAPSQWHHICTSENPADYASRGLFPHQISDNVLWFSGPPWLSQPLDSWPINKDYSQPLEVPELKSNQSLALTAVITTPSSELSSEIVDRYSSLHTLKTIVAWLLRFLNNTRVPQHERNLDPLLSASELRLSLNRLVSVDQHIHFKEEFARLENGRECSKRLQKLTPFIDPLGVIRVGGRLRYADLPYKTRHPIILAKSSSLSKLIIEYFHKINLHVGPRTLQAIIQEEFWIISARQVIRSCLSRCLPCLKFRTQAIQPKMADLPLSRLTPRLRPFIETGTDFGGPFIIKESYRRNARTSKAYLCLFICFATKAVHLEVVSDLSTEAFIAALDRFVSRRGFCSVIHSDCGTNYVGADRYLSDLYKMLDNSQNKKHVNTWFTDRQITWKRNPPNAPHFGGLWEQGIKASKHLLRRTIGEQALTFEGLTTIFSRVEAVLNSRPLSDISTSPNEFEPLTPAHFLIGSPLTSFPEPDYSDTHMNRLNRWELLKKLSHHFWNRWKNEYLGTLIQRQKWTSQKPNLEPGDLVLVNDGKSPALCWRVGRVTAIHPGPDKVVRVVTVRTPHGEYLRPVVKLAYLPPY